MLKLSHKNLTVWTKSIELVKLVYKITKNFPLEERYVLTSHIRRSAISVTSNIAEGASRISIKEKNRFFEIARSSLVELDTQFEVALTLNYVESSDINYLEKLLNHQFAMLSNIRH